jgi:hypothetical protein
MQNNLSPASAATEARARGDQLGGDHPKDNAPPVANQARSLRHLSDDQLYELDKAVRDEKQYRRRAAAVASHAFAEHRSRLSVSNIQERHWPRPHYRGRA